MGTFLQNSMFVLKIPFYVMQSLVAPSYSEGVSMAALEAMACGKAAVINHSGFR